MGSPLLSVKRINGVKEYKKMVSLDWHLDLFLFLFLILDSIVWSINSFSTIFVFYGHGFELNSKKAK